MIISVLVHILLQDDNVFTGKGEGALRYECQRCGNVSSEGLALGAGPECAKCGAEMVFAPTHKPPPGRRADRKRSTPAGRDIDTH